MLRVEKAKTKNEAASYPIPLTVEEAKSATINAGDKFAGKNAVISKMMSLHEVIQKRFEFAITRPVRILAKCAHEKECEFEVDAAYHVDQGNHCRWKNTTHGLTKSAL